MCNIGGMSPEDFMKFLMERATKRRKADAEREGVNIDDPKRPGAQYRIYSTLAYACSFEGDRYAGYSGTPGGMSHQRSEEDKSNVFIEGAQAERRLNRLKGIDGGGTFDPKKMGVPGLSGSSRPYCRCAEPAALSIAISRGEAVENLVFAAFYSPKFKDEKATCIFSPCPNCSMWLNRFAGGYYIGAVDGDRLNTLATQNLNAKHMKAETGKNRERRNSNVFIINPPRQFKEFSFNVDGQVYSLRCFKCA